MGKQDKEISERLIRTWQAEQRFHPGLPGHMFDRQADSHIVAGRGSDGNLSPVSVRQASPIEIRRMLEEAEQSALPQTQIVYRTGYQVEQPQLQGQSQKDKRGKRTETHGYNNSSNRGRR